MRRFAVATPTGEAQEEGLGATVLRFVLAVAAALVVLVAGMTSATLLDFEPGAWIAFGVIAVLVVGGMLARFGLLPGDFDLDGD